MKSVVMLRQFKKTDFIKAPGIRLWNPNTQMFLHLSGSGETKDETYAWRGFVHHAETLEARAQTEGHEWPYKRMAVKIHE